MKKLQIGIIGYGVVGSAVGRVIKESQLPLNVKLVCDIRSVKSPYPVTKDPYRLINDPKIDVIVETMGGINPAKKLVLAALKAGKHVVTSNKELVACHLSELLSVAARNRVVLFFEGAVGGGIPILNTLRESLGANEIEEIYGIVNGTTNYILSKMTAEGRSLSEVLKEAQRKGFAEANPKMDLEGYDAAYKAAILASVAFDALIPCWSVYREGIERITSEDIRFADSIGYVIKLLAIAKRRGGAVEVRVHPALVAKNHPLASINENFNAVYVKGFPVGELMFYGPGAGGNPTASAVISDILALNKPYTPIHLPLKPVKISTIDQIESRYYIRLEAPDRFGVLAAISKAFAAKKVSIAAVTQEETRGQTATIVILLHQVKEANLKAALKQIAHLSVVKKISNVIRIV